MLRPYGRRRQRWLFARRSLMQSRRFQPPELHPSSDMKPVPSSIKEAEAEQEKRTSRMTRARNRALAEAEKREPRRDAMLGRAVSARAPGGRWKRMQPKKKTGAGSDGGA